MHPKLIHLISTILLSLPLVALGVNAEENAEPIFLEVEDFPGLDDFESPEAFQAHLDQYVKQCRDTWISSSLGSKCGIEADLWDRELNVAYKALMGVLRTEAKEKLKNSQRSWISFRDETMVFSKLVLALH